MIKSEKIIIVFLSIVTISFIVFFTFMLLGNSSSEKYKNSEIVKSKQNEENRDIFKEKIRSEIRYKNGIKKSIIAKKRNKRFDNKILGFVFDKSSKKPIPNAKVVMISLKKYKWKETNCNGEGRFEIMNVPLGNIILYAFASYYDVSDNVSLKMRKKSKKEISLYLSKLPTKPSEIQLDEKTRELRGIQPPSYTLEEILKFGSKIIKGKIFKIVNGKKIFIPGVDVGLEWLDFPKKYPSITTGYRDGDGVSNNNGEFMFRTIYAGKYTLELTPDIDYDDFGKKTIIVKPDDTVIIQDLQLKANLIRVKGKLIDKHSKKVINAHYFYIGLSNKKYKIVHNEPDKLKLEEFEIYPVLPGKYNVYVSRGIRPKGYIRYKTFEKKFEISEKNKYLEIELERSYPSIKGTVVNFEEKNFDFQSANIHIKSKDGKFKGYAFCDKNGNFTFWDLKPGRYTIWTEYTLYHTEKKEVSIYKDAPKPLNVTLNLRKAFHFKGTVIDSINGSPLSNAVIYLYPLFKGDKIREFLNVAIKSKLDGSFYFPNLYKGVRYLIVVTKENFAPFESKLELQNSIDNYEARLTKGIEVKGNVLFKRSKSVASNVDVVIERFPVFLKSTKTDKYGNFSFKNVPNGNIVISCETKKNNERFKLYKTINVNNKNINDLKLKLLKSYKLSFEFDFQFSKNELKKLKMTKKDLLEGTYGYIYIKESNSRTLIEKFKVFDGKASIILPPGKYMAEINTRLYKDIEIDSIFLSKARIETIVIKSKDLIRK